MAALKEDFSKCTGLAQKLIISTLAGVTIKDLHKILFDEASGHLIVSIARAMPNIACRLGTGIVTLFADSDLPKEKRTILTELFNAMGLVLWEDSNEALMDMYTAVGASTPAFNALFTEAIADAAVLMGLPRDRACLMAAQAALGSATLMLEEAKKCTSNGNTAAASLKNNVCTPGGCSIKGIFALEKGAVRGHIMTAIQEACLAFKK